jgi:hypothetical protein
MDQYNQLLGIINGTVKQPTIVNPASNFVVTTYWWGRNNDNNNTARPCVSFYEDFINRITKAVMDLLIASDNKGPVALAKTINELEYLVTTEKWFGKVISRKSNEYMNQIYEYVGLKSTDQNKLDISLKKIEKLKETNKTPQNFEFRNDKDVFFIMLFIAKEFVKLNKQNIVQLFQNYKRGEQLKSSFLLHKLNPIENANYEQEIKDINTEKQTIKNAIKTAWTRTKNNYTINARENQNAAEQSFYTFSRELYNDPENQNKTINELLIKEFRYLNPIKFQEMIEQWENECRKYQCNFLSIEYSEFAQPGGYQMAINAKPLFIQKALELCANKNVLYIDGDMYIKKKPTIFEMTDVDFMARGWWMDPRSSYKMDESITYDPYTFETSGGTMFFSQSNESKILLNIWIRESSKISQQGKADDRILSLIFNTNKFLCNMKIIQLPIEYLWLSLDYDERMMEGIYDYNKELMTETIFIEHPECLTSEDTAGGAGASSDRTPKFYQFIESNIDPVSEEMYEYMMFPNKEMTNAFKNYFEYMSNITYLNDGNKILIDKGLINPEDSTLNEAPLYIINYDDKFGKRNADSEMTIRKATSMNIESLQLINHNGVIEIRDLRQFNRPGNNPKPDLLKIIALIIRLLNNGSKVVYNPVNEPLYDGAYYDKLMNNMNIYENLEMVFVPEYTESGFNSQFRPKIKLNQPIFFNTGNVILIKFLSMFLSLNDFSGFINNGSYQFMSRVRVGYLTKPKARMTAGSLLRGGNIDDFEEDYDTGLQLMYSGKGGKKQSKKGKTRKLKKYNKTKKNKNNNRTKKHKKGKK